jgi:anaerobic magnesium-protoporphyrin IX monomethyl ester cyclase
VTSGDAEPGIASYVRWLSDKPSASATLPPGLTIREGGQWRRSARAGTFLPAEEWQLPDIWEIPYSSYTRMYERDESKFCGIPQRQELVVPAARGCPIGCSFCDVPGVQGGRDRRMTVARTVAYIEAGFAALPFEYVAFYAPTFTLDRPWTRELCAALIDRGSPYPWKCATMIAHLPPALLEDMARSGCVRVSVGLETLEPAGQGTLPPQKRIQLERFHRLAAQCAELGVECNCFVIAGLPGTSAAGLVRTVAEIRAVGGRVRPTMYADIDRLRKARTLEEALLFNRHMLHPQDANPERAALNELVFGFEPDPTKVMKTIPQRQAL